MIGISRIEEGSPVEIKTWRMVAMGTALIPCIVHTLLIFVPMPARQLTVLLCTSFGPALAIASISLGYILHQNRRVTITTGDIL
ncbi:MAG: hypothetical protein A2Z27_05985 [candidate division Zixibacteria bacterium RBG_16_50_21]|nr:MAG: hypothetical protein A2Z27_05985 [candidate division Zixibacteria bacterium RBG_16_50_21]